MFTKSFIENERFCKQYLQINSFIYTFVEENCISFEKLYLDK